MTDFLFKWKYTPDLIFPIVLFSNAISIWSWEESPTSNDRITVNVNRRISPHTKIATNFLSWTLSICNNGIFKVNLEFSFSFPGFSFSGLDLVFKFGFQTWNSLHISIPIVIYCYLLVIKQNSYIGQSWFSEWPDYSCQLVW